MIKTDNVEPQPLIMPDISNFFTKKPSRNSEEFWDNQALLPGYQGVVVDTENNTSTQMLYNFLSTQINFRDETILDIGCGVGRLFPVFINFGAKEIHGIDISMNMLRVARFKYPQDNVYLYRASASDIALFPNNKFSLIISCCTLCHIVNNEEFEATVREMFRVCAKGGIILICEPMSITAEIEHEHSFMITRPLNVYKKTFFTFEGESISTKQPYLQEISCSREIFGLVDHIDSSRTVIAYRKTADV